MILLQIIPLVFQGEKTKRFSVPVSQRFMDATNLLYLYLKGYKRKQLGTQSNPKISDDSGRQVITTQAEGRLAVISLRRLIDCESSASYYSNVSTLEL